MMNWVYHKGPAGYLEEKAKVLKEIADRTAEIKAEKAQAAAKKAARPPKPSKPAAGPSRLLPDRQSRDEAKLRMTGAQQVPA